MDRLEPKPQRKGMAPEAKIIETKTYNSVIMALLTQLTAALILVASRHGVKRSTPPRIPLNTTSHPELGATKLERLDEQDFFFFDLNLSIRL